MLYSNSKTCLCEAATIILYIASHFERFDFNRYLLYLSCEWQWHCGNMEKMEVGRKKSRFSKGWRANYILNRGTREPDIPKVPLTPHKPPYFNPSHHHQHPPLVRLLSLPPCLTPDTPPPLPLKNTPLLCPPETYIRVSPNPRPSSRPPLPSQPRSKDKDPLSPLWPCALAHNRRKTQRHNEREKGDMASEESRRRPPGLQHQNFGPQGKASERAWAPPTGPWRPNFEEKLCLSGHFWTGLEIILSQLYWGPFFLQCTSMTF